MYTVVINAAKLQHKAPMDGMLLHSVTDQGPCVSHARIIVGQKVSGCVCPPAVVPEMSVESASCHMVWFPFCQRLWDPFYLLSQSFDMATEFFNLPSGWLPLLQSFCISSITPLTTIFTQHQSEAFFELSPSFCVLLLNGFSLLSQCLIVCCHCRGDGATENCWTLSCVSTLCCLCVAHGLFRLRLVNQLCNWLGNSHYSLPRPCWRIYALFLYPPIWNGFQSFRDLWLHLVKFVEKVFAYPFWKDVGPKDVWKFFSTHFLFWGMRWQSQSVFHNLNQLVEKWTVICFALGANPFNPFSLLTRARLHVLQRLQNRLFKCIFRCISRCILQWNNMRILSHCGRHFLCNIQPIFCARNGSECLDGIPDLAHVALQTVTLPQSIWKFARIFKTGLSGIHVLHVRQHLGQTNPDALSVYYLSTRSTIYIYIYSFVRGKPTPTKTTHTPRWHIPGPKDEEQRKAWLRGKLQMSAMVQVHGLGLCQVTPSQPPPESEPHLYWIPSARAQIEQRLPVHLGLPAQATPLEFHAASW